jgi:hypothetical protein
MKRIDQMQNVRSSYSFSSSSSSSTSVGRSRGVWEYWSDEIQKPVFCGLSLELSARTGTSSETVLPKAVRTAGIMIPGSNPGAASADFPRRAATISLERRVVSKQ